MKHNPSADTTKDAIVQQLYEEIVQLKNDLKREREGRADVANLLANYKLIARTNDIERDDFQRKHDSIYAGAHNDILNLLAVLKHGWRAGDYAVVEDIRKRWMGSPTEPVQQK